MSSASEETSASTAGNAAENSRVPESPDLNPRTEPGQASRTEQHTNLVEVTNLITLLMDKQSTANMEMFRALIREQGLRVPKEKRNTDYKPPRQSEIRIEPKSFTRMQQFTGGETDYKERSFDIETIVESVCPGFNEMIREYMEGNDAGKTQDYQQFKLEHAEIRSDKFYNLMCILTAGEAKLIIRDSGDGLEAWFKLWQTYNRKTLARSLR